MSGLTDYGFTWGAMEVTRLTEIDGRVVLGIKTKTGKSIQVYVSKAGRSLRVFGGGEWKP